MKSDNPPVSCDVLDGLVCSSRRAALRHFYLEKSTFAPGEPIFLDFEVVNDGPQAENLHSADPYSFCSGYQIKVSSDPDSTSSCAPLGFGGSCLSSSAVLPPGKKHVERLLLNFDDKIDPPGPDPGGS